MALTVIHRTLVKDKFCIINGERKCITIRFSTGKGGVPAWTDNFEFSYTYDTTEEAQVAAAGALVNSGFMKEDEYVIVPSVKSSN
ncbi:MAG TPA: hypothetical protein PLU53_09365 [Bacteroidia bacterium]|nr:hypothetical protein [Bacteroidia bacterium]